MWKAGLLLVLLFSVGHFAVGYLRTNPLDPVFEGGELIVETREHVVRLVREGPLQGRYLVASATSEDWSDAPANAELLLVGVSAATAHLLADPDQRSYGSVPERQLLDLSSPLSLIASTRSVYGELHGLLDLYEKRARDRGAWVCVSIEGEMLRVDSADSIDTGSNATRAFQKRTDGTRLVLATQLRVEDCANLAERR